MSDKMGKVARVDKVDGVLKKKGPEEKGPRDLVSSGLFLSDSCISRCLDALLPRCLFKALSGTPVDFFHHGNRG
jgi:hypothetical protein